LSARNLLIFGVLFAAAIGSWYLARVKGDEDTGQRGVDPVHRGFYLKSARILGTGPGGDLLYELRAKHAEEQLDGSIEFTDVRFDYSPEMDVPWTVNADSATILPIRQRVQLRGHVRARSSQGFSDSDTEIRTDYLELDPERYIAETEERVQIRIGTRSLTATGMLASLNDSRLELKSNVSGKFVP
jgi:lipopolysaccharide export system protein LptC